ncbi:uncharacterized protein CCOS01_12765 [Colletotrichum costaricense]|uniref:Uncharacterized protein n=1 Tax=Colletotrichum costaricense TaxID=1209916 RepID=A0AAI9YN51_9PEZI|nr:uncharacterized protein CCOS01_12765 [Colletotrichum costaricense]KAK1517216.1 hypothetical protein CCOS01_12765 [Colletotrichum costaricense]
MATETPPATAATAATAIAPQVFHWDEERHDIVRFEHRKLIYEEIEPDATLASRYAPPYKRRTVAVAAGSLSHFFDDTYGFSRARALMDSGRYGPERFETRFQMVLPTALPPPGPGGRAIVDFANRRTAIIQSRVAKPGSSIQDFVESGDQQDIKNQRHVLLYELPPTAAELRAWAEWDKNLPIMQAKYEEWQEARTVRINSWQLMEICDNWSGSESDSDADTKSDAEPKGDTEMEDVIKGEGDTEMEDETEEDSKAASEDED